MTRRRYFLIAAAVVLVFLVVAIALHLSHGHTSAPASSAPASTPSQDLSADASGSPTSVYAHNILLRKGPDFKVYIRWISGLMRPTKASEVPSFDDSDSFVLEIQKGLILARLDDISNFLNTAGPTTTPLKNISIEAAGGDSVKIKGTVHKIFSLPVEIDGQLSSTPDYKIKMHVTKINVLHVPMKGLLGGFHVELDDLVKMKNTPGINIVDNDILFDTQALLPPPHIHGRITSVHIVPPNLEVIYGGVTQDDGQLAQWHNFLRFEGGSLSFGRLTMHPVDLTMIDASDDPWFDLDLTHYQAQLVNGYTRMTSKAGLEIYMPDLDEMPEKSKKPSAAVTLDWLKNRNLTIPADVPVK